MAKRVILLRAMFLSITCLVSCSSQEEKKMKFYNKAKALYDQGDYVKARLELSNALQIDPEFADAYYMLGMNELNWEI